MKILVLAFLLIAAAAPPPNVLTLKNTWTVTPAAISQTGCPQWEVPQPYIPKGPATVQLQRVKATCLGQSRIWLFSLPRAIVTCYVTFPQMQLVNGQDTACTFDPKTLTFTYVLTPPGKKLLQSIGGS